MSKSKSKSIRSQALPLVIAPPRQTRLVLSCTEEEKRFIKVLSAMENKTISDYLLEKPREKMPKMQCDFPGCDGLHVPNEETEQVLKDSEKEYINFYEHYQS